MIYIAFQLLHFIELLQVIRENIDENPRTER